MQAEITNQVSILFQVYRLGICLPISKFFFAKYLVESMQDAGYHYDYRLMGRFHDFGLFLNYCDVSIMDMMNIKSIDVAQC